MMQCGQCRVRVKQDPAGHHAINLSCTGVAKIIKGLLFLPAKQWF